MTIQVERREFIALAASVLVWSRAVRAQPVKTISTVGVLWHAASAEEEGSYLKGLIEGFRALGYVEGRNIRFEHRFPNEMPERFKSMAAELVSLNVDVLVSVGNAAAHYVKAATSTVPIIFVLVSDPVESKLVDSFARPGGNATGLSTMAPDLHAKRLQLIKEMIPKLSRVAQLVNPNAQNAHLNVEATRAAATVLGLAIQTFEARTLEELEPAFDAIARAGIRAVIVSQGEGLPFSGREIISKLALARRLALCTFSKETFEPGALMSYGTDQISICRRAAVYADKILKGDKPGQIPIERPIRFEFLINLKIAKMLDIKIPPSILVRADQLIE